MVATATPLNSDNRASGRTTQARDAKRLKVKQLLDAQDVFLRDLNDKNLKPIDRVNAMRAWDIAEERIRILRGKVKPGSRNVSVREPHPSELKRIKSPPVQAHSSLYDYAVQEFESKEPAVPSSPPPIVPQAPADSSPA